MKYNKWNHNNNINKSHTLRKMFTQKRLKFKRGATVLKYGLNKDALKHLMFTLAAHIHCHNTGSPISTTTTTTDSQKPQVIVIRAHYLMPKLPVRSGCHGTAGDIRLWLANRTSEVQA